MTRSDAAFLEEVEDFLLSFDLPTFPTLRTLADDETSGEASPMRAVSTVKIAPRPVDSKKSRTTTQKLKPDAKRELEKEKDRKRRNAYRERRRVEKETLQQQVGELTTELSDLQKAHQAEGSLASSAWALVAKRQQQARVNAEVKQRRLVRAVEAHAALIQEMHGFVHNRLTNGDDEEFGAGEILQSSYKQKRVRLEPSDAEFYAAFVRDLGTNYAQVDEVLRLYGLESTDAEWSGPRQQWKQHDADGYYVFTDKHVMPFDFQQVCAFAWRVAQMHHRQDDRESFSGVTDSDSIAAFKFRVTKRLKSGSTVSVLQRSATRRYAEDGRSIVVWRSFTEGEGMFTGMHADECGWCVSVPLSGTAEPRTLIRTIMRHVPMHFSSKLEQPDTKQFTGVVLDTGTEDATEIISRLEGLLLQEK
ncbi:hypothetical protein KRP22_011879 [Phytophthora ramorum]|uniref:uncharacterized protein n=1 Tax=Phytophthora ramorum TaxID=164328 RepID=UPI0030AA48E5|nr:hypothetical protein KRP23_11051 [Phytophthora ramorum]KAH7498575.1 hypothetical protein KRP22_11717 [Phytophthora ramorum]